MLINWSEQTIAFCDLFRQPSLKESTLIACQHTRSASLLSSLATAPSSDGTVDTPAILWGVCVRVMAIVNRYRILQNGCRKRHLTHFSPLNFDLTLDAIPCIVSQKKISCVFSQYLKLRINRFASTGTFFMPESSLIAQVVTAKSGFKVQRWVAWFVSPTMFASTILQNLVHSTLHICTIMTLFVRICMYMCKYLPHTSGTSLCPQSEPSQNSTVGSLESFGAPSDVCLHAVKKTTH